MTVHAVFVEAMAARLVVVEQDELIIGEERVVVLIHQGQGEVRLELRSQYPPTPGNLQPSGDTDSAGAGPVEPLLEALLS